MIILILQRSKATFEYLGNYFFWVFVFEVQWLWDQVIPEGANQALYTAHTFKIMFVEGGVGTFIPLFMNLIKSVRAAEREALATQPSAPPADPLPTAQAPVDELIQHA